MKKSVWLMKKISLSNEIKVPNQILAGKIFRNSPNVIQLILPSSNLKRKWLTVLFPAEPPTLKSPERSCTEEHNYADQGRFSCQLYYIAQVIPFTSEAAQQPRQVTCQQERLSEKASSSETVFCNGTPITKQISKHILSKYRRTCTAGSLPLQVHLHWSGKKINLVKSWD